MAAVACIVLTGCQWPESREVAVPDVRHAVDIGEPGVEKFLGEGFDNELRLRMTFHLAGDRDARRAHLPQRLRAVLR